ncbi:putative UmuC protein [Prochlorococcus marinus str. MIT 9515]|uniref:Putative UmuC protein n=1 Tax=Prochlorococcus marinus (strain MIT 9515) TaxID=167542 RepID=A2BWR6_PROM5|nr:Y-family DNA polymerase [Prochlorococcus marinus]ABM72227.1 putative UmuC protein [Prochlorococcus marinus str. MIT 9515]
MKSKSSITEAIALIDANNFYASCEQSINPHLRNKPVVILSNNDGCIIARSPEARALRIKMGIPYFKVKKKLNSLGVAVLSSNYSLYGDMSKRLMNLLKDYSEEIEIYSIDEAFVSILRPKDKNLNPWARKVRCLIYQNLGITLTIGIAENKVRAKIANKLAKNIDSSAGIFDLVRIHDETNYLRKISVGKVWGVGKQTSNWLQSKGIKNVNELRDMDENEIIKKLGIIGKRLQLELRGEKCLPIETSKKPKKEIQVSRSFGKPITKLEDLTQALAIYAIKASEKMRNQNLKSSTITIFTRTSHYSNHAYQKSAYKKLINATDNTSTILKIVVELSKEIYTPGYKLSKAGVLMQDLTNCKYLQKSIINNEFQEDSKKTIRLMKTIDSLNKRYNNEVITWAIAKKQQVWAMNRNSLSSGSTTDIKKIPNIIK